MTLDACDAKLYTPSRSQLSQSTFRPVSPDHPQDTVAVNSDLGIDQCIPKDIKLDALELANNMASFQLAFQQVGLSDGQSIQASLDRCNKQEQRRRQNERECHSLVSQQHIRAQLEDQKQRHHQDSIKIGQQVQDWFGKVLEARERTMAACGRSFLWTLLGLLVASYTLRACRVYEGGLWGLIRILHQTNKQQCTRPSDMSAYAGFWEAPLTYTFGGVYNVVSEATASVAWASCYVIYALTFAVLIAVGGLAGYAAMQLPYSMKAGLSVVFVFATSDVPTCSVAVAALGLALTMAQTRSVCKAFMAEHLEVTATAREMNQLYIELDAIASSSLIIIPSAASVLLVDAAR
jgi:hypothetical protein